MKPLEVIHKDLCRPTRTQCLKGEKHFMFLIDDYSRVTWVTIQKKKAKAFDKFSESKSLV